MEATLPDHPDSRVVAKMTIHHQVFERNETVDQFQECLQHGLDPF
jgi:hypothetical protein